MSDESLSIWLDGATGTLGQAVRTRLEADGYTVVTLSRKPDEAKSLLQQHGVPAGLVCMSGIKLDQLFMRTKEADWSQLLDANLLHQTKWIQNLLPEFIMRGTGSIVLCSSLAARHPRAGQVAYTTTKGAVESFVRGLAREIGGKNIRINAVAPGFIASPMFDGLPVEERTKVLKKIPLNRLGTPKDVASVVSFLVSDKSSYMTGQTLRVDGGAS